MRLNLSTVAATVAIIGVSAGLAVFQTTAPNEVDGLVANLRSTVTVTDCQPWPLEALPSPTAVATPTVVAEETAPPSVGSTPSPSATASPTATPMATPTPAAREEASSRSSDRNQVPVPPNATPWQTQFILASVGPAQKSQQETGVPASVTIAQAALESDWGRSALATKAKNYFGIKASAGPGPAGAINMSTGEFLNGANVTVVDAFKAYHSMEESFADHGQFLKTRSRYAACFATTDPREFARRLQAAGYATDPQYAAKLIAYMDKFNLYAYDLP